MWIAVLLLSIVITWKALDMLGQFDLEDRVPGLPQLREHSQYIGPFSKDTAGAFITLVSITAFLHIDNRT